jgi:hypothetical protein
MDGSLGTESTKSSSAKAQEDSPQKARKSVPRKPRRHGPNAVYSPVYLHTGAVIRQVEISKILERLDRAFRTARRIDARQRKLEVDRNGRRSPTFRLAGVIKGIYNTLDKEHMNAQYVHDVRMKLVPVIECVPNLTGYYLDANGQRQTQPPPLTVAETPTAKIETPEVLKQEVVHV